MKKLIIIIICIAGLIFLISVTPDKNRAKFKVLDKVCQNKTPYKGTKVYNDFILILENKNKKILDIKVTPSTFYKASKGKHMLFTLEEKYTDIPETNFFIIHKNLMGVSFLILSIVLFSTLISAIVDSATDFIRS